MMRTAATDVPAWVTDGWYANDPFGQQAAKARYRMPVTTPAERAAVQAFVPARENLLGCASCGKFAFVRPTICFWCLLDMRTL